MKVIPLKDLAKQEGDSTPSYAFARRSAVFEAPELKIYAVIDAIQKPHGEAQFLISLLPIGVARWSALTDEPVACIVPASIEAARDPDSGFWLPGVAEAYTAGVRRHKFWWQLTCNSAMGYFFACVQQERARQEQELQAKAIQGSPQAEELQLLGLTKFPASIDALKSAWKRGLRKAHPDLGGSLKATQELNAAYEKLRVCLEA